MFMQILKMNKIYRIIFSKWAFLSLILLFARLLVAQVDCSIQADIEMPSCYGNTVTLFVADSAEHYTYLWSPGGEQTASIRVQITEETDYRITVTDTISQEVCESAPFTVSHHPQFEVQFEQLQLTCTNSGNENGNTAMLRATALGETAPYLYEWELPTTQIAPGNPSLAIGLKAHLWYFIKTTDEFGCMQEDSFFTRAYPNPKIEIIADPDTAFIQNPYVKFAFENLSADSVDVISHFWEFGDNSPRSDLDTPVHLYTEIDEYTSLLTVYNQHGCDTVYHHIIHVLPIKLNIPNIITPNNDGINDVLIITEAPADDPSGGDNPEFKASYSTAGIRPLSAYYKRTSLLIFNRQGRKVYESSNYNNDWGGEGLKDGVYFYVLQCEGFKSNDVYRGSITIMGSQSY